MARSTKFSSSSSANSTPRRKGKPDVFLSFRGEDTRLGFTDHLYTALNKKGIVTFRDKEGLESGDVIKEELFKAIEESLCAVVILSQNYASSAWCLDELQKIIESKHQLGQQVLPIFYGVDPSDVRYQKGDFAKAFQKHEERFKQHKEIVHNWRTALTEVANLSGLSSRNRYETEFIEEIAEAVWTKLYPKLPCRFDGLVGIPPKVSEMKSLLKGEDVCFVGIWGMGGIGKTTLARVVYEEIQNEFQISCFLADVRTISKDSLVHLQRKLLSCLNLGNIEINDEYDGRTKIGHFLCNRKVLLVLDDVSEEKQLNSLAITPEWFGPGSRVIITTRDKHLLTQQELFKMYDIELLKNDESLELFCQNAFRKREPEADYLELSKGILEYCGGLPLALEVLGSFLRGRSVPEWQDALNRMKEDPGDDILRTLKISYDGLETKEKAVFLDMACFYNHIEKNMVEMLLNDCGHGATLGPSVLVERSLLSHEKLSYPNYEEQRFRMHDLLEQLGRNIVLQESKDASKRSRLWSSKEIDRVLRRNEGTDQIQGMLLHLRQPYRADWHEDCFSRMSGLRLLLISGKVHLSRRLKSLPCALKVLYWEEYPLTALPEPDDIQLDELVHLNLTSSKLRQLWNGTQCLDKLKYLDLRYSKDLTRTPDFEGIPNLETLILAGCVSLVKVHKSLGKHTKLVEVDLSGCTSLTTLPPNFSMNSLEILILSCCFKLKRLPEFGENMEMLWELNLEDCKNLVCFPNNICNLKSLRLLNISGCTNFRRFPEDLKENKHLEELRANGTAIRELPSCVADFKNLKVLCFQRVPSSSSLHPLPLPRSFLDLSLLTHLDLSNCDLSDESIPDDFSCLSSLRTLKLMGNLFVYLPLGCLSNLLNLQSVYLSGCSRLRSLPQLPPNLSFVETVGCDSLQPLSDPQQLLNVFATHDFQNFLTHDHDDDTLLYGGDFVLLTSGNEVPSSFHNQNFDFVEACNSDSAISTTVDIPDDYLCSSEWSGIAVCLVLEDLLPGCPWRRSIEWFFESLGYEGKVDVKRHTVGQFYEDPLLFVGFFHFNNLNCWQHLTGGSIKRLELTLFTIRRASGVLPIVTDAKEGVLEIKGCGWRLICKQDFEMWCKTGWGKFNASTSTSSDFEIHFSGPNIRRRRVSQVSGHNQSLHEYEEKHPTQIKAPRSFCRTCSVLLIVAFLLLDMYLVLISPACRRGACRWM